METGAARASGAGAARMMAWSGGGRGAGGVGGEGRVLCCGAWFRKLRATAGVAGGGGDDEWPALRNVKSLIDSKLEKFKNLWEESAFYWGEIEAGTLKFDRVESEVALLRELKKEEFIGFFDQYIRVGAHQRKTISVQVFGGEHMTEFKKAIAEADPPRTYRITDIFGFKRSRPLYRSLKGGPDRIPMD
ncbi:hypothetical protein GUJ93_ZPchr0001g29458 [Zizania palustris]|uniref:Uncharacterized protein n=1 Tax=Zizania palustris TaxID=103762 RepID=A0A8J5VTV2_ZIZPA|nr:hypothetical protein GUJ93_ZPchr0001g29458 [Zizania palustris]